MIKHTIIALLIGILVFVVYLTNYLGAFQGVKISEGVAPTFHLLGRDHVGPYHKIVSEIEEVEAWAKVHAVDCSQSFGLYFDDPRSTEQERLKSFGGCWVSEQALPALPEGFRILDWTAPYFVKAIFEGSPSIGPMKVYPKVEEEIISKHLRRLPGTLEVYVVHTQKEMTTTYYFPVARPEGAVEH